MKVSVFLKYPHHVLITFILQSQIINHNIYINSSSHDPQWVSYRYLDKRKSPINGLFTPFMKLCLLFKLDFSNYILCLANCYIAIFCIIILDILCILHRFGTFCKHFATAITSNHSLGISLCTPDTHPLKYGTHSYCRLRSACVLL